MRNSALRHQIVIHTISSIFWE